MGQAKKNRRECPAVGRAISGLECGENRITHYACPSTCPHNPFGPENYSQVADISFAALGKLRERMTRDLRGRRIAEATLSGTAGLSAEHQYLLALLQDRSEHGRTLLETWRDERFLGLKNDEKVVVAAMFELRPALLEIERIVDGERLRGRDLLSPPDAPALEFRDSNLCEGGWQFGVQLIWIQPFPHYWRAWGAAVPLPSQPTFSPREVFDRIAAHQGYRGDSERGLREWITTNFLRLVEAFGALDPAQRRRANQDLVPSDLIENARKSVGENIVSRQTGLTAGGGAEDIPEMLALRWLEERVPALGGLTPRVAIRDAALRPKVGQLLRHFISMEDLNRVQGRQFIDYSPVAFELGFPELQHFVPAGWVPPQVGNEEDDFGTSNDGLPEIDQSEWPEHLLKSSTVEPPYTAISKAVLERHLNELPGSEWKGPALELLRRAYADFFAYFPFVVPDSINTVETSHAAITFLAFATLVAPPNELRYGFDRDRLFDHFEVLLAELNDDVAAGESSNLEPRLDEHARQAAVAKEVAAILVKSAFEGPKDERSRPFMVPNLIAAVVSLLDELDVCAAAWRHEHGRSELRS